MVSDPLKRLAEMLLPKASAAEITQTADRLRSAVGSSAAWAGETVEHSLRRIEELLSGEDAPRGDGLPAQALDDALWVAVAGELTPRVERAEALARDAQGDAARADLAEEVRWLAAELRASWAREAALRAAQRSRTTA